MSEAGETALLPIPFAALALAGPVAARILAYAYQAGVSDVLASDEGACLTDADKARHDPASNAPFFHNAVTPSSGGEQIGAVAAQGFIAGVERANRFDRTLYDRMASKGDTMRQASDADWKPPVAVRDAQVLSRLTAPEPVHSRNRP